ncbi:hypothetical protein IT407_01295 [Candidatus Uhrbacteria bacterium]|nr:hypothetical protein [Candidatus Uhrbacteria bacterium]
MEPPRRLEPEERDERDTDPPEQIDPNDIEMLDDDEPLIETRSLPPEARDEVETAELESDVDSWFDAVRLPSLLPPAPKAPIEEDEEDEEEAFYKKFRKP